MLQSSANKGGSGQDKEEEQQARRERAELERENKIALLISTQY